MIYPLKIEQEIESLSFEKGYRGAWFRSKIKAIKGHKDQLQYKLDFFDYPDDSPKWTPVYEDRYASGDPSRKKKNVMVEEKQLMCRPKFPAIYRRNQDLDAEVNSDIAVLVNEDWKVGNLVDLLVDGCYWSGKITQIFSNGKAKVKLTPPPNGEGLSYVGDFKNLRPSLNWSLASWWTVPTPDDDENGSPCVRLVKSFIQEKSSANKSQPTMVIAQNRANSDNYLEYASNFSAELQRLLNNITELDERSQSMINQTRQQTELCLELSSHGEDEAAIEKLRKEIETTQDNTLSLCNEKVSLAQQAYDLIDSHMKRLDEDLNNSVEDLKQEGKVPRDEPAIPPLTLVSRSERRKSLSVTPPPGSHEKDLASSLDVDQPIDPNEPTYCVCHQVSFGDMIACDNENCQEGEWFHYSCVGLTPERRYKGKWYCPTCRSLPHCQH